MVVLCCTNYKERVFHLSRVIVAGRKEAKCGKHTDTFPESIRPRHYPKRGIGSPKAPEQLFKSDSTSIAN